MSNDEVPLVFDEEIRKIIQEPVPLLEKFWPNVEEIKEEMIKDNLGCTRRTILHFLPLEYSKISFEVSKSEENEKGCIKMYDGNELLELRNFEKQSLIPKEPQKDFEATYNKVKEARNND